MLIWTLRWDEKRKSKESFLFAAKSFICAAQLRHFTFFFFFSFFALEAVDETAAYETNKQKFLSAAARRVESL